MIIVKPKVQISGCVAQGTFTEFHFSTDHMFYVSCHIIDHRMSHNISALTFSMDKDNKHQCLFCNAIFTQKGSLKRHEDNIHKNIKFDCQDCGKQYKQKEILTMHFMAGDNMQSVSPLQSTLPQ